jgi:HD-GYP domain-containing protein (c-di-GMP phosphodiesterase class II)
MSEGQADGAYEFLFVGVDDAAEGGLRDRIKSIDASANITHVRTLPEFEGVYETWQDGMFTAIFGGNAMEGMPGSELAQVFLNQAPGTKRYYVSSSAVAYEPRLLIKNGFMQTYLLPGDGVQLLQLLKDFVMVGPKAKRVYKPVRITDLEDGGSIGFSTFVFLPLNKKHVPFSPTNGEISRKKFEKLQERQVTQLYVDNKDMQKFYQYTAQRMAALGEEGAASATEREAKLREMVRGLFTDIFDASVKADFDEGREMIQQAEKIISNYITKGATSNWYSKLMSAVGESPDGYSHASNVSTIGALFAIGIGMKNPEDIAMAGLFHDLGLSQMPPHFSEVTFSELTADEQARYREHPELSLNIVKGKRIILTEKVEKAILQHHERWDGKGFPKGLPSGRISQEAQILSFADQFDYLTRIREGQKRLTPSEAADEIKANGSVGPELVSKIKTLMTPK